jgi:hypothetical protein
MQQKREYKHYPYYRTYALTERESCVVKEQGNEEDVQ